MIIEEITQNFDPIFIEPFRQGIQNIQAAIHGKAVLLLSPGHLLLDSEEKIQYAIAGILLLIPVINAVVYLIFKACDFFLFQENLSFFELFFRGEKDRFSIEDFTHKSVDFSALMNGSIAPLREPIVSDEEYTRRKEQFLEKLSRVSSLNTSFAVRSEILAFNLDKILQPYSMDHEPIKLIDFSEYANLSQKNKTELRKCLENYSHFSTSDKVLMAKQQLSIIYDYLNKLKSLPKTFENEKRYKENVKHILEKILNSHHGCVDQVNSQCEEILIEHIAQFESENEGGRSYRGLLKKIAALQLFKYRSKLIRHICLIEFPHHEHQADLERFVKKTLADSLNLTGDIFKTGGIVDYGKDANLLAQHVASIYLSGSSDLVLYPKRLTNANQSEYEYRKQVDNERKRSQYKPEEYLISILQDSHGHQIDPFRFKEDETPTFAKSNFFRNKILEWGDQYFDIMNTEDEEITQKFLQAIAKDSNQTEYGSELAEDALILMLEEMGIFCPI